MLFSRDIAPFPVVQGRGSYDFGIMCGAKNCDKSASPQVLHPLFHVWLLAAIPSKRFELVVLMLDNLQFRRIISTASRRGNRGYLIDAREGLFW
jgi:hypothetical protein